MDDVTDHIREEVHVAMVRQRLSQVGLAERVGLTPQHISALLNGHRGRLPEAWLKILDDVGLELVVRPKAQ